MRWWVITLLLCTYGVLKEFRPSEPFLYQYEHVTLNISAEILESKVYPIWTYSYMAFLVPVFLLTDLLLYKPIIILEALSYITVWMLFVLARSVLVQQLIEVFYGWATATEIAYFAYIYVKVDKSHYKKVTSYTRAALQAGKCVAYVLAQILIGTDAASYRALNVISLVSLWIALVFSLILPAVPWRLAYEKLMELQDQDEKKKEAPIEIPTLQDELGKRVVDPSGPAHPEATYKNYVKAHFSRWIKEIRQIYSELFVVKWSLWWAMASCAQFQIGNYTQTLWGSVHAKKLYNGITEAICPFIAVPVVLLMEKVEVDWKKWGELFLCLMSLIDGAFLIIMSQTGSIYVMYVCYIFYRVIYQAMITVAQFNLASRLRTSSFGLVFGLNTFVALVMQSILTAVVADEHGLALAIRPQFVVYSCFHGVIALIFSGPIFWRVIKWIRGFSKK